MGVPQLAPKWRLALRKIRRWAPDRILMIAPHAPTPHRLRGGHVLGLGAKLRCGRSTVGSNMAWSHRLCRLLGHVAPIFTVLENRSSRYASPCLARVRSGRIPRGGTASDARASVAGQSCAATRTAGGATTPAGGGPSEASHPSPRTVSASTAGMRWPAVHDPTPGSAPQGVASPHIGAAPGDPSDAI